MFSKQPFCTVSFSDYDDAGTTVSDAATRRWEEAAGKRKSEDKAKDIKKRLKNFNGL
jgi:hypothetical protein